MTNKGNIKKIDIRLIAIVFLFIAIMIMVEQYFRWGVLFELEDIHHELFISMFLFGSIIMFMLWYLIKNKKINLKVI